MSFSRTQDFPRKIELAEALQREAARLTQDFYLSKHFNPRAERHADTVEAAILYALIASKGER
jgi:hypothetical protein